MKLLAIVLVAVSVVATLLFLTPIAAKHFFTWQLDRHLAGTAAEAEAEIRNAQPDQIRMEIKLYSYADQNIGKATLAHAFSLFDRLGINQRRLLVKFAGSARPHSLRTVAIRTQLTDAAVQVETYFMGDDRLEYSSVLDESVDGSKYRQTSVAVTPSLLATIGLTIDRLIEELIKITEPIYGSLHPDIEIFDGFAFEQEMRTQSGEHQLFMGRLHDVHELNILSQKHLSHEIEGQPFVDWVEQPRRGRLEQINARTWSWKVPKSNIASVRNSLRSANLLTIELPISTRTDTPEADTPERLPSDTRKRDILLSKRSFFNFWRPTVTVDEFFDGNQAPGSIWPNLDGEIQPEEVHKFLNAVQRKQPVRDLKIVITQYDEGEEWPFSDTIELTTSASEDDILDWFAEYPPDEISLKNGGRQAKEGQKRWVLWWD